MKILFKGPRPGSVEEVLMSASQEVIPEGDVHAYMSVVREIDEKGREQIFRTKYKMFATLFLGSWVHYVLLAIWGVLFLYTLANHMDALDSVKQPLTQGLILLKMIASAFVSILCMVCYMICREKIQKNHLVSPRWEKIVVPSINDTLSHDVITVFVSLANSNYPKDDIVVYKYSHPSSKLSYYSLAGKGQTDEKVEYFFSFGK